MKLTLVLSLLTSGGFLSRALVWAQRVLEGFEGGVVVLPCTVNIQGDLRWMQLHLVILIRFANGTALPPENSPWKDVVSFVGSSSNLSLSLLSHQRDDNRTFWCEGLPGGRGQNTTLRVLAKITGASIEQASGGQVTVTEGKNITLTCALTGNPDPPPSYSWRVNGDDVTGQGSTYNLTANRSMKSIRCTATNMYSNGSVLSREEATATLNVLYLDTSSTVTHVNVTENEAAILPCSADGNPRPTFEWRRSGSAEVMSTSADYRIENVQRAAAGEYTCDVKNSVGSGQTRVTLVVQFGPGIPEREEKQTDIATIVGSVVGGVVLIAVIVLVIVILLKRRSGGAGRAGGKHEKASVNTAPKDGGQEMEVAENTRKPGVAAKPAKTAKTHLPIDDSYEPTDFTSTGANNNNPAPPQRRKLNYQEVAFDKTKKPPKSHPRESPTEYADINFPQRQ